MSVEKVTIDPDLQLQLDTALEDPALLCKINYILGLNIVGEEKTRLLLFVLGLSHKLPFKQIVIMKAESAAGKNFLVDNTIDKFMPCRKRGRMSATALDHGEIRGDEVLYIQQLFSRETQGTLKLVSDSDGGYIVEITVQQQDDDGSFLTTQTKKIPPVTLVTTTVYVNVDDEMETRAWTLTVDETSDQTRKILEFDDEQDAQKLLELLGDPDLVRQAKAQLSLKQLVKYLPEINEVLLPFELNEYFPTNILRVRRDFMKFKDLVRLIAYLHFKQRTILDIEDKKVLFATPADVWYAMELCGDVLKGIISGVDQRTQKIGEWARAQALQEDTDGITINELVPLLNKNRNTIYYAMEALVRAAQFTKVKRGKQNVYYPTANISNLMFSGNQSLNYRKLKNDFKKLLEHHLIKGRLSDMKYSDTVYHPVTGVEHHLMGLTGGSI